MQRNLETSLVAKMESNSCLIFNKEEYNKLTTGLQVSEFMKTKQLQVLNSDELTLALENLMVSDRLCCSFCEIDFLNQSQQRQHYKLDWHRYNLKQHLAKRKPVSEEKFSQVADDVSSISGSESESDSEQNTTETEEEYATSSRHITHLLARRARVLFQNKDGNVLAMYECLLHSKKSDLPGEEQLLTLAKTLPESPNWTIIMLGGGHFAAAVFNGMEPILHKTFHSYTVRAKQGGSQSSKDNKGSHSKSAGASLRRYNEEALTQHIQDILSAWSVEVSACQFIFYRAVGPFNRSVLFGGRSPPLNKNDVRLRTVPFPTRRATFSEVKRVHSLLASVTVYESNDVFLNIFTTPKRVKPDLAVNKDASETTKTLTPRKCIDRAKSRESPNRSLPDIVKALASCRTSESDTGEDNLIVDAEEEMVNIDQDSYLVNRLQEFADTVPKKMKKKKRKKEPPVVKEFQPHVANFRKKVYSACELGDLELLNITLEEAMPVITDEDIVEAVNQCIPDGLTLLQSAALHSFKDIVWVLLQHGGDPTAKDVKSRTAYDFAPDKETRNIFRRFMGEFPNKYDFSKSHIPSVLTDSLEQEKVDKKRAMRKAKRQKEKEKRIADAPRKAEEAEKKRYLELTDREKCALAAERRLLAAAGKSGLVLTRCYTCALDITGKVPFTYDKNLFCSMPCLKAHRQTHKTTL